MRALFASLDADIPSSGIYAVGSSYIVVGWRCSAPVPLAVQCRPST
jgi:hypothetical protein